MRAYRELRFEPEPGINVLIGPNGAGKTTVLEAIGYVSAMRSFRGAQDEALITEGAASAVIRAGLGRSSGEQTVEVEIPRTGRRRVLFNGKRPKRLRDLAYEVPVVAFLPDDLDLVKRGPAMRRAYVDDLAAQLWPSAGAAQDEYERALRQRNALLRREGPHADPATVAVWDERIADLGAKVVEHRLRLLAELEPVVGEVHRHTTPGDVPRFAYTTNWGGVLDPGGHGSLTELLRVALDQRRRRDLEQRTTTAGPHRDDPTVLLGTRRARDQASQGEQRSIALSLRVAAYRLVHDRRGEAPILLLDDVFSELDVSRSAGVMELLPEGQVFVTSAREDEVPVAGRRWRVEDGQLR